MKCYTAIAKTVKMIYCCFHHPSRICMGMVAPGAIVQNAISLKKNVWLCFHELTPALNGKTTAMAMHFTASSPFILHKHNKLLFSYNIFNPSRFSTITARSSADRIQEDDSSGSALSARAQLELLSQLTSAKESNETTVERRGSIKDQLEQLAGGREGDYSILLGKKNLKKVSVQFQTISQKRNIKRQAYLNEVSRRNDSRFFATVGAFVLVPPIVILGIATFTGYVQLSP